jgi:hypothetical protein
MFKINHYKDSRRYSHTVFILSKSRVAILKRRRVLAELKFSLGSKKQSHYFLYGLIFFNQHSWHITSTGGAVCKGATPLVQQ